MDTEEEESRQVPNVESSLRLEDKPATTYSASELIHETIKSHCELESVSELDESVPPAPLAESPVAEKEEEGENKGAADVEVLTERGPDADEEGGKDLIAGKEKHEILDVGDDIKASYRVDGNKDGVGDGEESHVAEEEDGVAEGAIADDVMEEMEKDDVSDERGTSKEMEVAVVEQQEEVAELAEEGGIWKS